MQGILWAAVLVLILAIVGCEIWRRPAPKVLTFVASNDGLSAPLHQKLQCGSPEAISSAKNYYDKYGQYAGIFVMDPISSYQVNENNCDVKFKYIPTPGSLRNDSEVDSRRFVYTKTGEGWQATNMLDWKSGVLNM